MYHPDTGFSICTLAVVKPVPLMVPLLVVLKIAAPPSRAVFLEKVLLELMAPCQPGRKPVLRQATRSAFAGRDAANKIVCPDSVNLLSQLQICRWWSQQWLIGCRDQHAHKQQPASFWQ